MPTEQPAEAEDKAQAKPYAPHADALKGPWLADNITALLSSEGEERMLKIPHGVDHFAKYCPNLEVLAHLEQHLEHLGVKTHAALAKHRKKHVMIMLEPVHNGRQGRNSTYMVMLEPVRDLRSYLLIGEDVPKLIRVRVLNVMPAFGDRTNYIGSVVLQLNKENQTIEGIVENYDQRMELFSPSSFTRSMVVCNLLAMHQRFLQDKHPEAPGMVITGCLAPVGLGYTVDIRWKGPRQVSDAEEALRVVKLLETPDSKRLDVLLFRLNEQEEVTSWARFSKIKPMSHDKLASAILHFMTEVTTSGAHHALSALEDTEAAALNNMRPPARDMMRP